MYNAPDILGLLKAGHAIADFMLRPISETAWIDTQKQSEEFLVDAWRLAAKYRRPRAVLAVGHRMAGHLEGCIDANPNDADTIIARQLIEEWYGECRRYAE